MLTILWIRIQKKTDCIVNLSLTRSNVIARTYLGPPVGERWPPVGVTPGAITVCFSILARFIAIDNAARTTLMTSFFYDVNLYWRAVDLRSAVHIHAQFWRFGGGGIWPPKCGRSSCRSKGHIFAWFRVLRAIVRQNPPTGHFSRRVPENKLIRIKNKASYFTYVPRRSLLKSYRNTSDGIPIVKVFKNALWTSL